MFRNARFVLVTMLLCFASPAAAQTDGKIAATWQVQKYDIAVTLPQSETDRSLSVRAKLDLKNVAAASASTLTLRISPSAEIVSVTINGSAVDPVKGEERAGSATLQKLAVRIPAVQAGGSVTAVVDYKLIVKENTGLASLSPDSSVFLPLSFWYPTPNSWFFARGADYAPFQITVSSTKSVIVSAGSAKTAGSYEQRLRSQPFFASGDWENLSKTGIEIYLPKARDAEARTAAEQLASLASEAKAFITSILGNSADAPVRIIAVRRGAGFSGGGTVLVDERAFRRAKIDSQTALSLVEGIAKIWLGGSTVISGDGEGAVREGLARYLAMQFIESKFGKDVADAERARQRGAYSGVVSRDAPITAVSTLDDYYYSVVANKGAMVWRLVAKKAGDAAFGAGLRASLQDGSTSLAEIRSAFPAQKEFLDYFFDQVTDTNLLAGAPVQTVGNARSALRNTGSIDVTVNVAATLADGERMNTESTVRAKSFGEVSFKTQAKVVKVEIDSEKLYPQTDYSDDAAPREFTESDPLLAVKRPFDKQDFAGAERMAAAALRELPRFDEIRVLLGRSMLAQGKTAEAEREFKAVLDEKLPSARGIAWANAGLAELAAKAGQSEAAARFAGQAIRADAEYGASLAARTIRSKLNVTANGDEQIRAFFAEFDRFAAANKKAELETLILPGEVAKFASGIAGQTEQWKSEIVAIDTLDANTALVEVRLTIKLLNRDVESGTAVFRLVRLPAGWKLGGVEIFEVR